MSDPLLGALWGIESMAERANVSIGTVMRFSKRLGYKGFSEFRDALREACQVRSEGAPLEVLESPTDVFWALAEVARRDQDNLNRLLQTRGSRHARGRDAAPDAVPAPGAARTRGLPRHVPDHGLQPDAGGPSLHRGHPVGLLQPGREPRSEGPPGGPELSRRSAGRPSTPRPSRSAAGSRSWRSPTGRTRRSRSRATVAIVLPSEDFLFSFGLSTFSVLSHAFAIAVASQDSAGTVQTAEGRRRGGSAALRRALAPDAAGRHPGRAATEARSRHRRPRSPEPAAFLRAPA